MSSRGLDFSSKVCAGVKLSDLDETAIEAFRALWMEKKNNRRIKNLTSKQISVVLKFKTNPSLIVQAIRVFELLAISHY